MLVASVGGLGGLDGLGFELIGAPLPIVCGTTLLLPPPPLPSSSFIHPPNPPNPPVTGLVYAAVLQLYGGPWLDCYEYPNLFPSGRAAYSGNKNAPNGANRASGGSGSKPRSKAAGRGADRNADIAAAAPVACEWKPDYSICDVCRSALCHSCKVCEHSTTGDCAPCREGIMPCIPLCIDHACW